MEFKKTDQAFVIDWIDRQFAKNDLFPCKCALAEDRKNPHVCASHMQAYRAWSTTPHKRSHIDGWIQEWMNQDDEQALREALQHRYG